MNEIATLIGTALCSSAVVGVLVKWLLERHDKRETALEETRRQNVQLEIDRISDLSTSLSGEVRKLTTSYSQLDKNLAILIERFKFNSQEAEKLMRAYQGFVEQCNRRFSDHETRVTEIAKEVYRLRQTKKGI